MARVLLVEDDAEIRTALTRRYWHSEPVASVDQPRRMDRLR